jgi:hypothetical protein
LISLQTQETPQHKMVSSKQHPTTATFPTLQRTAQAYQRIDCRLPVIKALSSIEGLSRTFLFTCTPPVKNSSNLKMASIEWALRVTFFPPQLIPKILPASSAKKRTYSEMDRFNRQRILSTFPQEHGVSVGVSFM